MTYRYFVSTSCFHCRIESRPRYSCPSSWTVPSSVKQRESASASFASSAARYSAIGSGTSRAMLFSSVQLHNQKFRSILAKWEVRTKKCVRRNMYAETLHAHIRRRRRRSSAPSFGRKMEARDSVPSIRRQGDALLRSGTGDTQHHSENAGAATPRVGGGRNRCADCLSPGATEG